MAQTPFTGLLDGSSSPFLASGDIVAFVDIDDNTQSPAGSLVKGTVTQFFAQLPVPVAILSTSATAFTVGRLGATTPALTVDASTASQVAGLKITGAATGGTVAVVTTDSGAATNLTINAKGTGTIGIGSVSTGRVTITPVTTITGALTLSAALTYGGVTLSNAVTGTGSMVLSASPTFTGTVNGANITLNNTLNASSVVATNLSGGTVTVTTTLAVDGASNLNGVTTVTVAGTTAPVAIGQVSDATTFQCVTLNNVFTVAGLAGLRYKNSTDSLYYNVPTGSNHSFRVNNAESFLTSPSLTRWIGLASSGSAFATLMVDTGSSNTMYYSTSSLRGKDWIGPMSVDDARRVVIGLNAEGEQEIGGYVGRGAGWYHSKGDTSGRRYAGFTSERAFEVAGSDLATFGPDGQLVGFQYERVTVYHNVLLGDHEARIAKLERLAEQT